VARQTLFALIIGSVVYGGVVYCLTRWAYYARRERHAPRSWDALAPFFRADAPTLSIVIPSYKEEDKVVFQTMLSAALQQYPRKRVVLLLDDPPQPTTDGDRCALVRARTLPARIAATLQPMARLTARARAECASRLAARPVDVDAEFRTLGRTYRQVIAWFEDYAGRYPVVGHADRGFVDQVLIPLSFQDGTTPWPAGQLTDG